MLGSLIMLLVFIAFWLKSTYEKEYASLQKESNFAFFDAIHDVQDGVFREFLSKKERKVLIDSTRQLLKRAPNELMDSLVQDVQIMEWSDTTTTRNSTITINISTDTDEPDDFKEASVMSAILAMTSDSSMNLDGRPLPNKFKLRQLVENELDQPSDELKYQIIVLDDADSTKAVFSTARYADLTTGEELGLEVSGYQTTILKRMVPNFIFALLLFGCFCLAFWMLHQNLQNQRRLTALKNDFISNITHELKTPITTVGVAIEALRSFGALRDPIKTEEYLNISKQELNRLSILVDKVLKMSLFEQKEPELKLEIVDVQELINNVLTSMKLQVEQLGAKINFDAQGSDFDLNADRIHLTSVIYNLIENALKYSPEKAQIDLFLSADVDHLHLQVADKGMGIPAAYQSRIFDKFFRVPTGDQHNIKGHGLGLSYVASVVDKHNGTIDLESMLGQGTTFTLTFPIRHG